MDVDGVLNSSSLLQMVNPVYILFKRLSRSVYGQTRLCLRVETCPEKHTQAVVVMVDEMVQIQEGLCVSLSRDCIFTVAKSILLVRSSVGAGCKHNEIKGWI